MRFLLLTLVFLSFPTKYAFASYLKIFELNPILIVNQGIGIETEFISENPWSVGFDFAFYFQNPYDRNAVKAGRDIQTFSPKIRYYFFKQTAAGLFAGAKLNFTHSKTNISDSDTSANYEVFFIAPIVHIGYRFYSESGLTFSAYVGGGAKSNKNTFKNEKIPASKLGNKDWKNAQDNLNLNQSIFQPDFGFTFGYIF